MSTITKANKFAFQRFSFWMPRHIGALAEAAEATEAAQAAQAAEAA
jgi:hypothetical protein